MSAAEQVEAIFRDAAARLEGELEAIVAVFLERVQRELPRWIVDSPYLSERLASGARHSIGHELSAFRYGARVPATPPAVDLDGAREAARLCIGLEWLLLLYRTGHWAQWHAWLRLVGELPVSDDQRQTLLDRGSRFFFSYASQLSRLTARAYSAESATNDDPEQRRLRAVIAVLEGRPGRDVQALDYDLDGHHVGVVAWGADARPALTELSRRLDCSLTAIAAEPQTWWAWLGGTRAIARPADMLLAARSLNAGRLGVGRPALGVAGFRTTHQEALFSHRVARVCGQDVVLYDDVAIEALALADPQQARRFVAEELAGIDDDAPRSQQLRQTLMVWFRSGQNAAAAGAALDVHEQTVAQRLRSVQERTGRPPAARRAELETALRVRRLLEAGVAHGAVGHRRAAGGRRQ